MTVSTRQSTSTITVTTTPTLLFGSSPARAAIVMSPFVSGGASVLSVSFRSNLTAGVGMLNFLAGVGYVVVITDGDVGDIIQTEWWAVVDAGSVDVQVTEVLYG